MPVKGVSKVRSSTKKIFKDIKQKKAVQFINAVLSIGLNESKNYAPIEYSNLVNSALTEVDISQGVVRGTLSYNVNYAAALEFGNWKPRAVKDKAGPATNMNATPHYLKKGFESADSQRAIDRVKDIFKI